MFKSIIKNSLELPLTWYLLKRSINNNLCVPCFHAVCEKKPKHLKFLNTSISLDLFLQHLTFFTSNFDVISPEVLIENIVKGKSLKEKCLLTFDDGYRECYDIIYPELKKQNLPALFFITSNTINNKDLLHFNKASIILSETNSTKKKNEVNKILESNNLKTGNLVNDIKNLWPEKKTVLNKIIQKLELDIDAYLTNNQPYLTDAQIREMHSNGYEFGAHSTNHIKFSHLNDEQQIKQIKDSLESLEFILNKPIKYFAFPYSSKGFFEKNFSEFNNILFYDTYFPFKKNSDQLIQRLNFDYNKSAKEILITQWLKKYYK